MRTYAKRSSLITVSAAALIAAAGLSLAGPLSPPAGPISSTMKTLVETEPRIAINATNTPGDAAGIYRITQPGSYYLTGNITGMSGRSGIVIAANEVTIDLNGFVMQGVAGSLDGISVAPVTPWYNLVVKNGTVRGWGSSGISLINGSAFNQRVESIRASHNGSTGIVVGDGATVVGCNSYHNTGSGYWGHTNCQFRDCIGESNSAHGFYLETGCTISGCTGTGNTFTGITAADNSSVSDCTVSQNRQDGIRVAANCRVVGNNSIDNGYLTGSGSALHATGANNRIEGNNCTGADVGLKIDVAGNFIVRNTCSNNTQTWSVAQGNACYVVTALTGAAIFGDNGGSSLGTSEPNANFTY